MSKLISISFEKWVPSWQCRRCDKDSILTKNGFPSGIMLISRMSWATVITLRIAKMTENPMHRILWVSLRHMKPVQLKRQNRKLFKKDWKGSNSIARERLCSTVSFRK
jgi:hypothetical protein